MFAPTRSFVIALTSALFCAAQTPQGFEPAVSKQLLVNFGSTKVNPAGITLPKDLTQTQPTIGVESDSSLAGTYIFMMIDLDVPVRDNTTQAVIGRTHLLHCLQGNFTVAANGTLRSSTAAADSPAPYRGPSPPAENPPVPHRYTQLLFEQPAQFAVPASQADSVQQRRGFNITSFIAAAGLGAPIRGNYFEVVNSSLSTSPSGTGVAPTLSGLPTPTSSPAPGAANSVVSGAMSGIIAIGAALALL